MLVAILADRGVDVIGIASGKRVDSVRAAGANHVIDRISEDVRNSVLRTQALTVWPPYLIR
jgi:NADPH2:quinone reductase